MTPDEVLAVADAGRRAGCKERLKEATAQAGFELRERLAIYPEFVREDRLQSLSAPVRSRVLALVDKTGLVPQEEERW
jgi:hypothetical protein